MQGYAAEPAGGAFAQSREYYAELEKWLSGDEAGRLRHAELARVSDDHVFLRPARLPAR